MSRGLGRVQLAILDALLDEPSGPYAGWRTAPELTAKICGPSYGRSDLESVRRSMKSLARSGFVELDYVDEVVLVSAARVATGEHTSYRRRHAATRSPLAAHLTLSVEEREAREAAKEQWLAALAALDQKIDSHT